MQVVVPNVFDGKVRLNTDVLGANLKCIQLAEISELVLLFDCIRIGGVE